MASRQTRRPIAQGRVSGAGIGVDTYGGPAIDPTENVLALVDAESKRQDQAREADFRFQSAMREAETRRQDDLARQKRESDATISNMLRVQVENTSVLLSTQLTNVTNALTDRIAKLEQFRWESGGKTSVTDPATAEALAKLASAVAGLTKTGDKADGHSVGQREMIAWAATAAALIFSYFKH